MTDAESDRIAQAWHDATDNDVLQGLRAKDDYSPEVFSLIQDEALKRGIDVECPPVPVFHRSVPTIVGTAVWEWVCAHRLITALLLGAGMRLAAIYARGHLTAAMALVFPIAYFAILVICVAALSHPLVSYRTAASVAAVATCGSFVVSLFEAGWYYAPVLERIDAPAIWVLAFGGVVSWSFLCLAVCIAVFIRKSYWPGYPSGCCKNCGYDLRGLPIPRCPECGTPFEPSASDAASEEA